MAIKTFENIPLYINTRQFLPSMLILVTIKAELRSNSGLLEAAPTRRVAKRSVLDGYFLSRVQVH